MDHDRVPSKMHRTTLTRPSQRRDSMVSCGAEDKCYCSLGEPTDGNSSTTWCDSDSCISNTKCYCKGKRDSAIGTGDYTPDNLALDYELFTIDNGGVGAASGKQVRANEALSAKKSVEMAALFADFKLTQTTDIKNMMKSSSKSSSPSNNSSSSRKKSQLEKSTQPAPDSLNTSRNVSLKKGKKSKEIHVEDPNCNYQSIPQQRPVSATLEDSLGYLP